MLDVNNRNVDMMYFTCECNVMFQVLSFFFVCLWLVPFGFFISLSANDMVLPTIGEEGE